MCEEYSVQNLNNVTNIVLFRDQFRENVCMNYINLGKINLTILLPGSHYIDPNFLISYLDACILGNQHYIL